MPDYLGDRHAAAQWARYVLDRPGTIILDTETTGMDAGDQVIELAIIDMQGTTLYNQQFRPTCAIHPRAQAVHGLTLAHLAGKPLFAAEAGRIAALLTQAYMIISYNIAFDRPLLIQTFRAAGVDNTSRGLANIVQWEKWSCAMLQYAGFVGEWHDYRQDYKWQPLTGGDHSALGNCRATLVLIQEMAAILGPATPELPPGFTVKPCKGCEAPIIWARHAETDDRIPLNAEPEPCGNLVLEPTGFCRQAVGVESRRDDLYRSHWCPQRAQFSRPRGGKGEAD